MRCSNGYETPRDAPGLRVDGGAARAARRGVRLLAALAFAAFVAGCSGEGARPRAQILRAALLADPQPVLEVTLDLGFSPVMLEALERGIALELVLELAGRDCDTRLAERRTLRLRYLPLVRRWQLRDASGAERHFARRAQLLAALDRVRIPLDGAWLALRARGEFTLRLSLDTSALPGPLRLPALLRADWRMPTASYAWHAAS